MNRSKNLFLGGPFGGPWGVVPPNYVKTFFAEISTDLKKQKQLPQLEQSKKLIFWAPCWGFLEEWPQKILGDKIAFAGQQLYTIIRLWCVVVYEKKSAQHLESKKKKKKAAAILHLEAK